MNVTLAAARAGLFALSTSLLLTGTVAATSAQTSPLPPLSMHYVDEILDGNDLVAASALISPGAILTTPEGSFVGPAGVGEFTAELGESFSNLDFEITGTHVDGDDLVIEFTMTGTQTGTYQGIPGRCAEISVPGEATLDLDQEMVQGQVIDYDRAEIVRQASRYNQLASFEGISCASNTVAVSAIAGAMARAAAGLFQGNLPPTDTEDPDSRCLAAAMCALP